MSIIDRIKEEIDKLRLALPWGACSAQKAAEALFKDEAYNEVMDALDRIVPQPGDGAPAQIGDEKTYRALVERIYSDVNELIKGADKRLYIELLEKQKDHFRDDTKMIEQKPEDDKAFEEWIDDWWKHNKVNNPDSYDKGDEIQFDERGFKNFCRGIRNMYQQKPAEWSEEDEKMRNLAIEWAETMSGRFSFVDMDSTDFCKIATWLKSLRPVSKESLQSHWKPSEEQIVTLEKWLKDKQFDGASRYVYPIFESLYEQLKKLM